jgi:NAD(P)-dependent dehydrogenase (short-subunit alcohol dehydrogenase family)
MSAIDASTLLRPGLLEQVSVLLALASHSGAEASFGGNVEAACADLGARVCVCECGPDVAVEEQADDIERAADDAIERALADAGGIQLLAVDAASVFSRAAQGDGHRDRRDRARHALGACLDTSWNVTRLVADRVFLPESRGGRIVYLAPPSDAGEHAQAACAGLENLARTLSIEWARHGVTAVAIAPGIASAAEVAALTAYLASPAGAYFSGCLLDLRGPARSGGQPLIPPNRPPVT